MIAFVFGKAFAQMSYDFNDGTAGAKIAETYGMPWTTWTNAPGGSEDGVFAEMGGSMATSHTNHPNGSSCGCRCIRPRP